MVNVIIIHSRPRQNGQAHLNFLPVFIAERKNLQLQNPCYYHQVCGLHCVLQRLGFTGVLAVQPEVLTLSQAALSHPAISPGPFPSLSILHALLEKLWPSSKSEKPVTNEKKKSPFLCLTYFFLTITINLREIDSLRFHPGAGPRQRRIGCALQPWPLSQHRANDVKPRVPLGACRGNSDWERVPL